MSHKPSFRRTLGVGILLLKVIAAVLGLAVVLKLQFDSSFHADYSYGTRAAVFAFAAAVMWLYELIPTPAVEGVGPFGWLAPWSTRVAGVILAFLTSWNWILAETAGAPFPLLWPVAALSIHAVLMPSLAVLVGLLGPGPQGRGNKE